MFFAIGVDPIDYIKDRVYQSWTLSKKHASQFGFVSPFGANRVTSYTALVARDAPFR